MPSTERPRVLFYVQHLLGIGHLRRASLIAQAMAAENLEVHVVLGGTPTMEIGWDGATVHQLPPLTAMDSAFSGLVDPHGTPPNEAYWRTRREALISTADALKPAALLIELYPFGRRPFRQELLPLLDRVVSLHPRPRVYCSLRDILVDKDRPDRDRETVETVERFFDRILVHGDADFVSLGATFPLADTLAERIVYTGYVAGPPPEPSEAGRGDVIVAAGGGAVGGDLLLTALAARPLSALSDRKWRLLTGPNLDPAVAETLNAARSGNIIVEPNRADYPALLANAAVSISQGGYNTVMDIIQAKCPAVIVPFAEGGESEQTYRAGILADRGYLSMLGSEKLSPTDLANAIDSAVNRRRPPGPPFALDGASRTARFIVEKITDDSAK